MAKRRKSATVQLKVRMKEAVRAALAAAAEEHEVTLNAEVVDRLEKSIGREKARHEEFGGRELYGLLKMMAGAAAMIEERRGGKKWSEDYETGMAARAAWQTLITQAIPPMPDDLKQQIQNRISSIEPIPDAPAPPELIPPHGPALLFGGSLTPEEQAANEAAKAEHAKKISEWEAAVAAWRERANAEKEQIMAIRARFDELASLGRSAAEQVIPPRGTAGSAKPWHSDW